MQDQWAEERRDQLQQLKQELDLRLSRINESHRRPLDADSKERATELENQQVVDALGNETVEELRQISGALARYVAGQFGTCTECGDDIDRNRLTAYPHAEKCISCATLDEDARRVV